MEAGVQFILLLILLFIVPKLMRRWAVPEQLTEIFLGILLGPLFLNIFQQNVLISVMGIIGIITLFFMAGFEIHGETINKRKKTLIENGVIHLVFVGVLTGVIMLLTPYSYTGSLLLAIAFLTPSAGFILAAVRTLALPRYISSWIDAKVVSAELLSLFLLLIALQMQEPLLLGGIILLLWLIFWSSPFLLHFFLQRILGKENSHAHTFLVFVFVISLGFLTHAVGVHYIIGGFIGGVIMNRFVEMQQTKIKINEERIHTTFSSFSSIFVPFYFFSVGLLITREMLTLQNIIIALLIFFVIISIRIAVTFIHRRFSLRESFRASLLVSLLTAPTLLFTFVIAEILITKNIISTAAYGVLLLYGLLSTSIPYVVSLLEEWIKKQRNNN